MGEREGVIESDQPYFRAAQFNRERASLSAYNQAQELLFRSPCELSAYRVLWETRWLVAVVGETPPDELDQRIERILSRGEATSLPSEMVQLLQERGIEARRQGPWTERHFRPEGLS